MRKIMIGVALLTTTMVGTAAAAPSLNGPTGLINTATADVVKQGDVSLGYYNLKNGAVGNVNIGLVKNVEIGGSFFDPDGGSRINTLNAKWSITPETVVTPGLAIGLEDVTNKTGRTGYIVGSKGLPFGFRVHYGVGNGRYDGVFGGIEKTFNPISVITGNNAFPATTLMAEYDGHDLNVGARLSIVPGVKLDAGWKDMKDFYVGCSVTL